MDFSALKDLVKNIEPVKQVEKKKSAIVEEAEGYYTMPCTKEPFNGLVIKLTGDEFYVFFQRYSSVEEYRFRERLEEMDKWFYDKPYKVQQNWARHVAKWLRNDT